MRKAYGSANDLRSLQGGREPLVYIDRRYVATSSDEPRPGDRVDFPSRPTCRRSRRAPSSATGWPGWSCSSSTSRTTLTGWCCAGGAQQFLARAVSDDGRRKISDSRIEPVEDWKHDVLLPLCVVYTDHDKDHWYHASANLGDRTLTVTFELLIAQISDPEAGFVLEQPNTDSELETSLDIFELQISNALRADNAAANCWRHLCMAT